MIPDRRDSSTNESSVEGVCFVIAKNGETPRKEKANKAGHLTHISGS